MKPLALDTPLHVEQRWIAGLRAREARLQADALDLAYLRHWAMALGVGTLLQWALDEAGLPNM
jgi:hypothetical protein